MKLLFEIPIYSTSREVYEQKWKKKIRKSMDNHLQELNSSDIKIGEELKKRSMNRVGEVVSKRYFSWQYNKIIGFLTVNYDPTINIIIFDIALDCKKHPYDSNNKGPIIKQNLLGEHFRVDSKMTNAEIQGEIKDYVKRLSEVDLKRYYVDKRAFENIINVVDFKSIISSI